METSLCALLKPSRLRRLSRPSSGWLTLVTVIATAVVSCSIPADSTGDASPSTTGVRPPVPTSGGPGSSVTTEPIAPTWSERAADLSQEERTNLLASCLQERGWPVELDEKDSSAIDVPDLPDEQEVIFLEDVRTCRDENGLQIAEPTRGM